jgi:ferritin-like metal-binding protein YciE
MRRQLLGGLRDAFAAGAVRLDALRHALRAAITPGLRQALARTAAEAEAQQRRLDYAFASLRDVDGGGLPGMAAETLAALHRMPQGSPGAGRDAALAGAIRDELARAAEEAATLRLLALAVGLRRVAGLLGATAAELRATAAECGRFAPGLEHPARN